MLTNAFAVNLGNNNQHLLVYLRGTFKSTYYFGLNSEATRFVKEDSIKLGALITDLPPTLDVYTFRPDVVFVDLQVVPKDLILKSNTFFKRCSPLLVIHADVFSKDWDEVIKYLESQHDYRIGDSLGHDYLLYSKSKSALFHGGYYRKYQEFIF